jgi:hypothetical protein
MGKTNKSIIINGVGSIFAMGPEGKNALLGSLQTLRFDFSVTEDPVFGGDGLFPIDYVTRDKGIAVAATNAKFDLNVLRLATGATLSAASSGDSYTWVLNKPATVQKKGTSPDFTYEVDIFADGTPFSTPEYTVMDMSTGDALTLDSVASAGKFAVVETTEESAVVGRKLVFHSDMDGKMIVYSFKKATTDIALVEGKKTDLPIAIKIIHQGNFKQKDDQWHGIETEIKLAKASGTFTIDFARATASASTLNLNMIDPEDGTCRLWTMKRFVTAAPPCM